MAWANFIVNAKDHLNIINAPNVEIDRILKSDAFVSEMKSNNHQIHTYLSKNFKTIVNSLITYALVVPSKQSSATQSHQKPYLAIEFLESIINAKQLTEGETQWLLQEMSMFFSNSPKDMQSTLYPAHFYRIFSLLYNRYPQRIMLWFSRPHKQKQFMKNTLSHIQFQSVCFALSTIVLVDLLHPMNVDVKLKRRILTQLSMHLKQHLNQRTMNQLAILQMLDFLLECAGRWKLVYDGKAIYQILCSKFELDMLVGISVSRLDSSIRIKSLQIIAFINEQRLIPVQYISTVIQHYLRPQITIEFEYFLDFFLTILNQQCQQNPALIQTIMKVKSMQKLSQLYFSNEKNIIQNKVHKIFSYIFQKPVTFLTRHLIQKLQIHKILIAKFNEISTVHTNRSSDKFLKLIQIMLQYLERNGILVNNSPNISRFITEILNPYKNLTTKASQLGSLKDIPEPNSVIEYTIAIFTKEDPVKISPFSAMARTGIPQISPIILKVEAEMQLDETIENYKPISIGSQQTKQVNSSPQRNLQNRGYRIGIINNQHPIKITFGIKNICETEEKNILLKPKDHQSLSPISLDEKISQSSVLKVTLQNQKVDNEDARLNFRDFMKKKIEEGLQFNRSRSKSNTQRKISLSSKKANKWSNENQEENNLQEKGKTYSEQLLETVNKKSTSVEREHESQSEVQINRDLIRFLKLRREMMPRSERYRQISQKEDGKLFAWLKMIRK